MGWTALPRGLFLDTRGLVLLPAVLQQSTKYPMDGVLTGRQRVCERESGVLL